MSKAKHKADISDFYSEMARLLSRYSNAGCCPGCMGGALISAAIGMVAAADGVCWPAGYPEEVNLIAALAKLMVDRTVGAPSREALQ